MSALVGETNESHAIEVAAMLGNSVVGVKHCIDPRSGKITSKTWALLGVGALALVMSAIAFVVSVSTAAANHAGYAYWTHTLHRPAGAFRAEILSPAWDWLAFGGLSIGLTSLVLALVRVRDERRSPYYRIGTAPDVEQPIEGAPVPSFPLVAPMGDQFVFHFAPGIDGEVLANGKSTPLSELAAAGHARPSPTVAGAFALPIPPQGKIRARAGKTTFLVASMPRPRRHATPLFSLESRTVKYFAGSLVAHLGILALAQLMPQDAGAASIDPGAFEPTTMAVSNPEHDQAQPIPQEGTGDDSGDGAALAAMTLPEGSTGDQKQHDDPARLQVAQRPNMDPQLARAQAIEEARIAGVLGNVSLVGNIADVASDQDFSSGFDTQNVAGSQFGPDGAGGPGFGYGRSGFGPGGGGVLTSPGGYGTICDDRGHCKGRTGGYSLGTSGGPGGHGHHPAVPLVAMAPPRAIGGLDKSIIRRYIKQNLAKISYCYEHELLAHPDLAGQVEIHFFIQPDGSVKNSAGTGFDGTVAQCVAGVIGAIELPRPGDGGVEVNYPFTFHPAGH